jgi:ataxin-10
VSRSILSTTSVGVRLCMRLLDGMVRLYDAEEVSDGGKAFDIGCALQLYIAVASTEGINRYSIFMRLIEDGRAPKLYVDLSM